MLSKMQPYHSENKVLQLHTLHQKQWKRNKRIKGLKELIEQQLLFAKANAEVRAQKSLDCRKYFGTTLYS